MKGFGKRGLFLAAVGLQGFASAAEPRSELRHLERPYRQRHQMVDDTRTPMRELRRFFRSLHVFSTLPDRSDLASMLERITGVRDQGDRGTCSVFSSVAALESMMIREKGATSRLDLSEQWLAFLVATKNEDDGSDAPTNVHLMKKFGIPSERALPYEKDAWDEVTLEQDEIFAERCGGLRGEALSRCRFGHYDPAWLTDADEDLAPKFARARLAASEHQAEVASAIGTRTAVDRVSEVKKLLSLGIPVILEFDFYYGAWNSGEMKDLGMGDDDPEAYARGEVGYPEKDSRDRAKSVVGKHATGHSVLVVGYDDDETMSFRSVMKDGEIEEFTYSGVYYFKNSWGTETWGSTSRIDGRRMPGFGKITQKYAHELGSFYRLTFE